MQNEQPLRPLPLIKLGLYQHYKGKRYQVYGVARHSETLEPLVIYRALYGESALWVRPHAMFISTVLIDGQEQARFEWIGEGDEVGLR